MIIGTFLKLKPETFKKLNIRINAVPYVQVPRTIISIIYGMWESKNPVKTSNVFLFSREEKYPSNSESISLEI